MSLRYSAAALLIGFLLDAVIGDPPKMPHIIRAVGNFIALMDKKLPKTVKGGAVLVITTVGLFFGLGFGILYLCYYISPWLGVVVESLLCFQLLAAKSLKKESMKVYTALETGSIEDARYAVSMIVGRDTKSLDSEGITRAAVETVAENASDGVIAPILYIALGGGALGLAYKAVNTMDSMVGYKNDKYLDFGRYAAKLDDIVNFIPARIAAFMMLIAAFISGFDGGGAFKIWRRDRFKHASPNSAQTESVCAGALGIRLAGPTAYFGKIADKPYIGDEVRKISPDDIKRANRLMYFSAVLCLVVCLLIKWMVTIWI